jgi:hypothetical protein
MSDIAFDKDSARQFFQFFGKSLSAEERAAITQKHTAKPLENPPLMTGARNEYENSYLAFFEKQHGSEKYVNTYNAEGNLIVLVERTRVRKPVLNPITTHSMRFLSEWMCAYSNKIDFEKLVNEVSPEAGVWLREHFFQAKFWRCVQIERKLAPVSDGVELKGMNMNFHPGILHGGWS